MVLADILMIPGALYSAIWLHAGTDPANPAISIWPYVGVLALTLPMFAKLGLYRAVVRYIGAKAIIAVFAGVTLSAVALFAIDALLTPQPIPFPALIIYWALALIYVAGS
ncbi:MAG: polysaccharide biosynthesis protein, partial [Steroidobacteraceae bacterium]